jgi:hypothetical protein
MTVRNADECVMSEKILIFSNSAVRTLNQAFNKCTLLMN